MFTLPQKYLPPKKGGFSIGIFRGLFSVAMLVSGRVLLICRFEMIHVSPLLDTTRFGATSL